MRKRARASQGNEVNVEMSFDPRARAAADVDPRLDRRNTEDLFESQLAPVEQREDFAAFVRCQIGQPPNVAYGDDHQMSGRVGIEVQDGESAGAAIQNQVGIPILIEYLLAKDAPDVALDRPDIGHTPWRPKGLHSVPPLLRCRRQPEERVARASGFVQSRFAKEAFDG